MAKAQFETPPMLASAAAYGAAHLENVPIGQSPPFEAPTFSPPMIGVGRSATVLIEHRTLLRDCLVKCLEEAKSDETILAFATASDWLRARPDLPDPPLILLCAAERREADVERDIECLAQADPRASIVLLSEGEDSARVLGALDKGVRGYIPTSMPFDVAMKAIHLVRAGGTFVPAGSLRVAKASINETHAAPQRSLEGNFTTRQLAVIAALRQGKANKIIAFELNMRESTVKVHVRNIMKKLQAKNRTEVAFRVNAMGSLGGCH